MTTRQMQMLALLPMMGLSIALAAEPAVEQLKTQVHQRTVAAKQFGTELEQRFERRDRQFADDARQEMKLSTALTQALSVESRATLQHMECRSGLCKASIQLASAEDRQQILFALLTSNDCGVAVPENRGTSIVAYLDCPSTKRS